MGCGKNVSQDLKTIEDQIKMDSRIRTTARSKKKFIRKILEALMEDVEDEIRKSTELAGGLDMGTALKPLNDLKDHLQNCINNFGDPNPN